MLALTVPVLNSQRRELKNLEIWRLNASRFKQVKTIGLVLPGDQRVKRKC